MTSLSCWLSRMRTECAYLDLLLHCGAVLLQYCWFFEIIYIGRYKSLLRVVCARRFLGRHEICTEILSSLRDSICVSHFLPIEPSYHSTVFFRDELPPTSPIYNIGCQRNARDIGVQKQHSRGDFNLFLVLRMLGVSFDAIGVTFLKVFSFPTTWGTKWCLWRSRLTNVIWTWCHSLCCNVWYLQESLQP